MKPFLLFAAPRRVFAPAGESLFSAGPGKSNQKRGPEHQPFGRFASAKGCLQRLCHKNNQQVRSSVGVLVPETMRSTSVRSATVKWLVFEALCFGDFHLGPQMKVTRQPGRDPARCTAHQKPYAVEKQSPGGHS